MGWMESISEAITYMEAHMTETLTVACIAKRVHLSPFYFQKGFTMLCGFTVTEYIRNRKLALAASELVATDIKIIDLAIKYGYESPDSFTKAFTRFHGVTPSAVRKEGAMIQSFAPLQIKFTLEGAYKMEYKIVEKEAFTVIGAAKTFSYHQAKEEIPTFWKDFYAAGKGEVVCGMYGINIDEKMEGEVFEYLIADDYVAGREVPEGFVTRTIPKQTWAIFVCKGPMPQTIQQVSHKIFSEWLPSCANYEIAAGYNIEMYSDVRDYPEGVKDANYYWEMWIPVKKK